MRTLKIALAILLIAVLLSSFALATATTRYRGEVPAAYRRELPPAAKDWKLKITPGPNYSLCLGPLRVGTHCNREDLELLGPPDQILEPGLRLYYGYGLIIGASERPPDHYYIWWIAVGNRQALHADEALVAICPFAFDGGLRLGAEIENVRANLRTEGSPEAPGSRIEWQLSPFANRRYRFGMYRESLVLDNITFEFSHDQLVAVAGHAPDAPDLQKSRPPRRTKPTSGSHRR